MTLPYLILLCAPTLILAVILFRNRKNTQLLKTQLENNQKTNAYQDNLIKEIQMSLTYGDNLEKAVQTITNRLNTDYPCSTLCSMYVKGQKLVFKSIIKESVNNAFVQHIKDNMLESFIGPDKPKRELEENISGSPLNDLSSATILSSYDFKIIVNGETEAIINLSSASADLYPQDRMRPYASASEIISGFLSKIESQLDIEKSKTLSMIDSFSEGIFMVDKNQNLMAINNSALNFLNIHAQIPSVSDILLSLPNTYNFKGKIDEVINTKKQVIEDDLFLNGKTFKAIIMPVLEIHNDENVMGATFLLQDTTVEKSLNQMKEDFTNIMVHELRSPLTAIRASSEFLSSQADLTTEEKKKLIIMISEASKRMLDKIALILDSAKMDAGLFSIKKTSSDLKKLIENRISVFTQVAQEKSIALSLDLDPHLTPFSFDPIRIDEVINNLLSNGLKFTPSGGAIRLKASREDGNVKVSVSDTGLGIPKDKQANLFSKFQQAPTDGQHVGTGLGLYVVKGVVEAHGGSVKLDSVEGHGTTISFTLPITGPHTTASVMASHTPPEPLHN